MAVIFPSQRVFKFCHAQQSVPDPEERRAGEHRDNAPDPSTGRAGLPLRVFSAPTCACGTEQASRVHAHTQVSRQNTGTYANRWAAMLGM